MIFPELFLAEANDLYWLVWNYDTADSAKLLKIDGLTLWLKWFGSLFAYLSVFWKLE
jgi:hypothetical protein